MRVHVMCYDQIFAIRLIDRNSDVVWHYLEAAPCRRPSKQFETCRGDLGFMYGISNSLQYLFNLVGMENTQKHGLMFDLREFWDVENCAYQFVAYDWLLRAKHVVE